MDNPFATIDQRLTRLEGLLIEIKHNRPSPNQIGEDLITIDEAAELLRLAKPTLYSKCSRKELPFMKRGKRLFFSRKELVKYLEAGKQRTLEEIQQDASSNLIKKEGRAAK